MEVCQKRLWYNVYGLRGEALWPVATVNLAVSGTVWNVLKCSEMRPIALFVFQQTSPIVQGSRLRF